MDSPTHPTVPPGAVTDPERGLVYSKPPLVVDDLTRIRGIDPVLQDQLNYNGVYRYEQIGIWQTRNITEFARLLSCSGHRIEYDYWVWEAQRLMEESESETGMYERTSDRSHSAFPASLLRTAVVLALSLLLGVVFVQWLQLRDARSFHGNVFAKTVTIQATRKAEIAEIFVQAGDVVEAQQDVAILHDNNLKQIVAKQRREVEKLARELDNAVAKSEMDLKWRLHELDREILENRLMASNKIKPTSLMTVQSPFSNDRFKEVSHRQFTSEADEDFNVRIEQRNYKPLIYFRPDNDGDDAVKAVIVRRISPLIEEKELTASPERRRLCEDRIRELQKMKDGLALRIRQAAGVDLCETKHAHALAELAEFERQATEFALKTTRTGTVSQIFQAVGSQVHKGDAIVQIMDTGIRHVVVKVPPHEIARFDEGTEVEVIFAGHHKRTARVEHIPVEVASATHSGEPALSVTVVPTGRLWPAVPIGSAVKVRARK